MPINVTSTSNNMDTLSRNELIGYINDTLELSYSKVEQMCSGLFPNSYYFINLKFSFFTILVNSMIYIQHIRHVVK